jgi:hypothetical protein
MLKEWGAHPKAAKKLDPGLLGQANIPKPLHGINPRSLMGRATWDKHRQVIIHNNPYCHACGAENCIFELHEDYEIDYTKSIMTIRSYVPLCKLCHNFIHSGFLQVQLDQGAVSREYVIGVVERGIDICARNNVRIFKGTELLAQKLKIPLLGVQSWTPKTSKNWSSWTLEYQGKKYQGMSYQEWLNKYRNKKV